MRAFVRRTPALHAAWLEWRGPRRRARVLAFATAAGVATSAVALDVAGLRGIAATAVEHPVLLAVVAVTFASIVGGARRARLAAARTRDWTGALPAAAGDARRASWLATGATAAVAGVAASLLVLAAASALPDPAAPWIAFAALWLSLAAGTAVACVRRPAPERPPPPGSRYVPATTPREWQRPPTLAPLAAWPFREAFVRSQPRAASRAALPVLLLLPAGIPAGTAVALLAVAALAFAVVVLGAGTFAALRAALRWLAPTPAARGTLVAATTRPALLAFAAVALATATILAVLAR